MSKLSLKARVIFYVVILPACILASLLGFWKYSTKKLSKLGNESFNSLSGDFSKNARATLGELETAKLRMLAKQQAAILETQLARINDEIENLAKLYTDITKGKYEPKSKSLRESQTTAEGLYSNIALPAEVKLSEVHDDVKRLKLMEREVRFFCVSNSCSNGVGIALPSGVFFKFTYSTIPADFDPRLRLWYKKALKFPNQNIWIGPYYSIDSWKHTISCARAIERKGKIVAVLVVDLKPETLARYFYITLGTSAFSFLIDEKDELVAKECGFDKKLAWKLPQNDYRSLRNGLQAVKLQSSEALSINYKGGIYDLFLVPLRFWQGWRLGVAASRQPRELELNAISLNAAKNQKTFNSNVKQFLALRVEILIGLAAIGFFIFIWVVIYLNRLLVKPLRLIKKRFDWLNKENFQQRELKPLVDGLNDLTIPFEDFLKKVRKNIITVKQQANDREQLKRELSMAAKLQQAILPAVSSRLRERDELEIAAAMQPAVEVGGDFYDFAFIDANRVFFAIGDVSGKGLPASLFMVRVLTMLRHEVKQGYAVNEVLTNVSRELEYKNDSCMFATCLCGILDLEKAEVTIANAGHNLPLLRHKNEIVRLELQPGAPIGALGLIDKKIEVSKHKLEHGDTLFLYTDGVTESFDFENNTFGDRRLKELLDTYKGATALELVNVVSDSVAEFTKDMKQADDITIMALKYYG